MATLSFDTGGAEKIFMSLSNAPRQACKKMLAAGAKVLIQAQKASGAQLVGRSKRGDSQHVIDSIAAGKFKQTPDGYSQSVYPQGDKRTYHSSKGGVGTVTQAEVAFIWEYGCPRRGIGAKHWIQKANDSAEPAVMEAMQREWDAYNSNV